MQIDDRKKLVKPCIELELSRPTQNIYNLWVTPLLTNQCVLVC